VAATYGGIDPKRIDEIAVWRDAFATCGWTPSKYPSSIEALLKRVSRGQPLPRVSPIVDLSNACSLTHRVPIGSHDILALRGTLTVRPSEPGDTFVPMGESPPETPDVGEIVYVAGHSVRTRRWVWRQGRDALISPTTTDVFFPIDGFESTTGPNVRAAMAWLADRIEELFGARAQTGLVHSGSRCFANT
jgi:DNA/RNA-binding domain of Phe-tRNA-synthetase-like protein